MKALVVLALLGLIACSKETSAPTPAQPVAVEDPGPKEVVLTIKAPPGQLVETPQGLWLKANLGTEDAPIEVRDGPASIAELGFSKTWVDHPPCPVDVGVASQKLTGGVRWIDRVRVRCQERWYGDLFFDLTDVVERQIESLRGADNPRALLGLDKPAQDP
jgi:hypothetical protein